MAKMPSRILVCGNHLNKICGPLVPPPALCFPCVPFLQGRCHEAGAGAGAILLVLRVGLSPALVTFLWTPLLHVFASHSETDQGFDSKAEFPALLWGFWRGLQTGFQSPGTCLAEGGAGTRHCRRVGMWILVPCSGLE